MNNRWFRDLTGVALLALEMSSGVKILKESNDCVEFKIESANLIDKVIIKKNENLYEVFFLKRGNLCGYKSKINETDLLECLEKHTGLVFSFF